MREFLKSLELDKDVIDKIMAEHGKAITESKDKLQSLEDEKTKLENKIKNYENKITELNSKVDDSSKVQKELDDLKKSIEEENTKKEAEKKDNVMTQNILTAIGDKKFINDYTKNAIVSEVKTAMSDEKNAGKSTKDLFDEITKDKDGIFANPNKPADMAGTNQNLFDNIDKETFKKMGYQERVNFKAENPDLFAKLNNE